MKRLLFALGFAVPAPAFAWQEMASCGGNNYTAWAPGNPNSIWQLSTSFASTDLSNSEVDSALNAAFNEWGVPGCSEWNAQQGTDVSGNPEDGNDENHLVGFDSSFNPSFGSTTLAVTLTWWWNDCEIGGSDMVINQEDHTWVVGQPGSWNEADLQSVIAHEAGHWIGLDHSNYSGSSLTAYYSGALDERTLTCDDTDASCTLYPSGGTSCSANRYCPCGVACDANGYCDGVISGDDDDDSTPVGDDDTVGDDDSEPTQNCSGSAESYEEDEPNDWQGDEDVNWIQPGGGDLSISGNTQCGNDGENYTGDGDWFVIDVPCADDGRFTLDWSGSGDMDFYIWGSDGEEAILYNYDQNAGGPTSVDGAAGGRLYLFVACWEGPASDWIFTIDWAPFGGGSGDDDDDTTPADDDTSDDDTTGDDDTSADDDASDDDTDDTTPLGDDDGGGRAGRGCICTASGADTGLGWAGALMIGAFAARRRRR